MLRILEGGFPSPGAAVPYPPAVGASDRLALTVFVAIVVHLLVILGVTFVPQERERREQRSLDVLLVQERAPAPPEEAHYIAEADQQGAGPRPEPPAAPSAPPASAVQATIETLPPEPPADAASETRSGTEALASPPARPLSQTEIPREHEVHLPAPSPAPLAHEESPLPDASELAKAEGAPEPRAARSSAASLRARVMEDLSAEIDERLRAYEERPRRKWITARTREHAYAAYMEAWREKVERIGNLNYPQEARRRGLSGSLSLDVALNADGSVAEILLRRSSGEAVLDEAALRIVRLAAPFAELPPSIRREVDILHIERTWQFSSGNRFNSR